MHQFCPDESLEVSSSEFLPWRDDFDEKEPAASTKLFMFSSIARDGIKTLESGHENMLQNIASSEFVPWQDSLGNCHSGTAPDGTKTKECGLEDKPRTITSSAFLPWRDNLDDPQAEVTIKQYVELLLRAGTFGWSPRCSTHKQQHTVAKHPNQETSTAFLPWRDAIDDHQKCHERDAFDTTLNQQRCPLQDMYRLRTLQDVRDKLSQTCTTNKEVTVSPSLQQ